MNELVAKIKELSNAFFMDAVVHFASVTTDYTALEKLLKEFRKASLEEAKK